MSQTDQKGGCVHYFWAGLVYVVRGFFQGLGLIFLISVILAVIAYLGLRAVYNEERIRSVFVAQIQDIMHRPVQIDKVLLDPRGVKLLGLRVAKGVGLPGQYFLTSDTVLATIKLTALLRRRLELDQVRLVAPHIQLVRDEAGHWDLADVFVSTQATRARAVGRLRLSLAADQTRIERGLVVIEDRFRGGTYRFDKVNLTVTRFAEDRPFAFTVSCDNTSRVGGRTMSSTLALDGVISLAAGDWSQSYLQAKRISLTVDGVALRGSGSVKGLPPAQLDVEAALPALGPLQWQRFLGRDLDFRLPPSRWELRAALPTPQRWRVLRLRVDSPPLAASVMGMVDFSSATLRAEASVTDFPLNQLEAFYPAWGRLGLRGTLNGTAGVAGRWSRVQLQKGSLHLRHAGGRFRDLAVDDGDIAVSASDNLENVTFSAAGATGRFFASPFSDLTMNARLRHDNLELDRLSLRLIGSRVALKARVRDLRNPKEIVITGSVDRVRWEPAQALVGAIAAGVSEPAAHDAQEPSRPWVSTFKYAIPRKFPDTVGHIVIGSVAHKNFTCRHVDMLWDIHGVSPSLKYVSGDVRVSFGPGRVADIPAVQASNKFLQIVFLPFIYMHKMNKLSVFSTATAYPKTLDFTRIEGEYGLRQGVATTRLFYVDSPQMIAFTDGIADFGKETTDMNIMTRLTSYGATLPQWWVDEKGRPAIAFRVKGDLNMPELEPRLSKMASDEIEKALAEARARAKKRYAALDKFRRL